MTTFFLILFLLDSAQFGYAPKQRMRRVSVPGAVATGSSEASTSTTPSPVCTTDENGELTCHPIDQADKFRW